MPNQPKGSDDNPTVKIKIYSDSTKRSHPQWSMSERFYTKAEKAKQVGEHMDEVQNAPGPGKYGVPSTQHRFQKVPNVFMAHSQRETARKFAGAPGPGSYTPYDPNEKKIVFGFGSASRIPKDRNKEGHEPKDPFKYCKSKDLDATGKTMAGRGSGGRRTLEEPGPGAYKPNFVQTEPAEPRWGAGTGGRSNWQGVNKNPPPWHYKGLPASTLGQNATSQSSPSFSLVGRKKPLRGDNYPSPFADFSQFHK